MAKVHYVRCALCDREYYLDRILQEVVESDPSQKLKCPYCKKEFRLGMKKEKQKEG